jgi:hypothetical protein
MCVIFQVRGVKAHVGSRGRVVPLPPPRYDFMFNHRYSLDSLLRFGSLTFQFVTQIYLFLSAQLRARIPQ